MYFLSTVNLPILALEIRETWYMVCCERWKYAFDQKQVWVCIAHQECQYVHKTIYFLFTQNLEFLRGTSPPPRNPFVVHRRILFYAENAQKPASQNGKKGSNPFCWNCGWIPPSPHQTRDCVVCALCKDSKSSFIKDHNEIFMESWAMLKDIFFSCVPQKVYLGRNGRREQSNLKKYDDGIQKIRF